MLKIDPEPRISSRSAVAGHPSTRNVLEDVGSFYYLAYAAYHAEFEGTELA